MYARADSGEIEGFPGISAPYEVPEHPDLRLRTDQQGVEVCVDRIVRLLEERSLIET